MRILFIGGLYRGLRLAERLLERGEELVGALVYDEDPHESPKYADKIASLLGAKTGYVHKTRRITADRMPEIRDRLAPDVIFCLGWRTLIPSVVLECAPLGGVAVHDSLLPRLRGFAPTNWGMILGHDQLGATLFQLTDSVDAGDIYFQEAIAPDPHELYESIQERIAQVAVRLFDRFLDAARDGKLAPQKQNHSAATYTCSRSPSDGEIRWQSSSLEIERVIRALGPPAPGAFTYLRGEPLVLLKAHSVEHPLFYEGCVPGRVVDRDTKSGSVDVLCGQGVLRIEHVRNGDGIAQPAAAVMRSVRESLGLNYSREIISLRERLSRLEAQLAEREQEISADRPEHNGTVSLGHPRRILAAEKIGNE
jgi:methionyl-tRNA formyltransferase